MVESQSTPSLRGTACPDGDREINLQILNCQWIASFIPMTDFFHMQTMRYCIILKTLIIQTTLVTKVLR